MKTIDPQLVAHLEAGTTTLAWCWRLTRNDGTRLGFTDHDRDIVFDGTVFEAAAGLTTSEIRDGLGLSVDNLEVESALTSDRLNERDLAAGQYDDAKVEIFRVNWQEPGQRVLMRAGSLGEVRRAGVGFAAEVRGLAHYLQQPQGRLYQYTCDADLGDARCGIGLDGAAFSAIATITQASSRRTFVVDGLTAYADAWFARGMATFLTGPATGVSGEVREHRVLANGVEIALWQPLGHVPAPGETFQIRAGCDKHLTTCRAKFANAVNFRGFPHMPGNDFLSRIARGG